MLYGLLRDLPKQYEEMHVELIRQFAEAASGWKARGGGVSAAEGRESSAAGMGYNGDGKGKSKRRRRIVEKGRAYMLRCCGQRGTSRHIPCSNLNGVVVQVLSNRISVLCLPAAALRAFYVTLSTMGSVSPGTFCRRVYLEMVCGVDLVAFFLGINFVFVIFLSLLGEK